MEISFVNNDKAIQPKQIRDQNEDTNRNVSSEDNKKYTMKNRVDSAEVRGVDLCRSISFDRINNNRILI